MFPLPFWLIVPFDGEQPKPRKPEPCRPPLAFSSAEKLAAFLEQDRREQWHVRLVTQSTANAIMVELEEQGLAEIQFVPDDRSSFEQLSLSELGQHLNLGHNRGKAEQATPFKVGPAIAYKISNFWSNRE